MLAGCASLKDISDIEPLPLDLKLGLVNLKQDVCLFSKSENPLEQDIDAWLLVNNRGAEGCAGTGLLIKIPAGESVELLGLIEHTSYGLFIYTRWYVVGSYETSERNISFYYELPWFRGNDGELHNFDTELSAVGA